MSKPLVIVDTVISQDAEGRYSLNDLHRAAGGEEFPDGEPRHQPRYFLANQQAQDLITEISTSTDGGIPLSVKKGGHNQGTYVCKELVYAYAMWISPAFHLKVIRAYDALATTAANTGISIDEIVQKVLPALTAAVIPAIMTGVVDLVKTITAQSNQEFQERFETKLASAHIGVSHGVTVGDILDEFKITGIRGLSVRLSRILCEKGCQVPDKFRARMGRRKAKLFLPDRSFELMRDWLAEDCRKYIQERKGQKSLNLVVARAQ